MSDGIIRMAVPNPLFSSLKESGEFTVGTPIITVAAIKYHINKKKPKDKFTPICYMITDLLISLYVRKNYNQKEVVPLEISYFEISDTLQITKKSIISVVKILERWKFVRVEKGTRTHMTKFYFDSELIKKCIKEYIKYIKNEV